MSLILSGIDGSNPLAFLAALGTLRTLVVGETDPPGWLAAEVGLKWVQHSGAWRPAICTSNCSLTPNALMETLRVSLVSDIARHPLALLEASDDIATIFRNYAAAASLATRGHGIDWLSALCSELAPHATCQLQTTRRDYFLGKRHIFVCNYRGLRQSRGSRRRPDSNHKG